MNYRSFRPHRATFWAPLAWLLIASVLISACTVNVYVMDPDGELAQMAVERAASDEHAEDAAAHEEHDPESEEATASTGGTARLLVADGESGQLHLIDLQENAVIAEYAVAGPANLYTSESGRFAAAVQTEANQVHFVDSGLWVEEHGDHTHNRRIEPVLLPFHLDGAEFATQAPVHFVSHYGWLTVHFDGNAEAGVNANNVRFPEAALLTEAPTLSELSTAPQHGVSIVTHDGALIISEPNTVDPSNTLPNGFAVYGADGASVTSFNDVADPAASCVGMHGEVVIGDDYLFGCHEDDGGVLVITAHEDGSFTGKKIAYPDGRRTSVLVAHPQVEFAVGQYGAYPTYNGLVRIDPAWDAIPAEAVVDLPANQCGFAFDQATGKTLVALTEDGYLHAFDPTDWTLHGSLQVTAPFECFGEAPAPSLAVGQAYAYISSPATGEVFEIDIATLAVVRSWQIEGQPSGLAAFGWYTPLAGTAEHAAHTEAAAAITDTRLIVADPAAGGLTVYRVPDWAQVAEFPDLTFADHPGYIVLPDGRVLFTTHENELIVLDATSTTPSVVGSVSLPGTAIHLAVDPDLEFVALSTADDETTGAGEDTLTLIDLTSLATSHIELTTGEPGVLVGDGVVLHRDGDAVGRLEAFPVANFATADATPTSYVDIGAYGHGEALVDDHAYVLTDDGVDIVHIAGDQLEYETVLPWNVSGREGGRGYYLRADAHGNLWSYLRIVANPEDDAAWENWQDWQNDGYLINTATKSAQRFELGAGLVYRMALSSHYALYSRLHPDGDEAILVDADPASATFAQIVARIPLPAASDAPITGVAPWEAAGQRMTGITPDGAWGFVSGGGDGLVYVIDTATQQIVGQITTPTTLDGGGYLLVVQPGQPLLDNVGR